jgi:hypothetical protein
LILEQMFEDRTMAVGGLLASEPGREEHSLFPSRNVVITTLPVEGR